MKKITILTIALAFCLLLVAPVFGAQASAPATPENSNLHIYPYWDGPLPLTAIAQMKLRPIRLSDWIIQNYDFLVKQFPEAGEFKINIVKVFNYHKKTGWVLEYLDAALNPNEILLVDESGEPRYLQSCGNRIAVVKPCPEIPTGIQETVEPKSNARGPWEDLWEGSRAAVKTLLCLIGLFAFCAVIISLIMLIWWLIENWRNRRKTPPTAPPAPPATPPPAAPATTVPGTAPPATPGGTPATPPSGPQGLAFVATTDGEKQILTMKGEDWTKDAVKIEAPNCKQLQIQRDGDKVTIFLKQD